MKEFLSELEREASRLDSKSLGPIGFDYRRRTKLERLLFLITKRYCKDKLEYDLGGLNYTHQRTFAKHMANSPRSSADVELATEAFDISKLISDLSSSDPYAREEAMGELGGTVFVIFDNLSDRIRQFISKVEARYSEE